MTTMLKLDNVTLICLTNRDFEGHKRAMELSSVGIEWGAKKIIWDDTIKDIDDWNRNMIYDLTDYVQTDFAMVFHADGYVIRPDLWKDKWLQYDWCSSPWPLPQDSISYKTPSGRLIRVGNSVSLRSKKLLDLPRKLGLEFKPFHGNTNEDGKLCVEWRDILEENGCKFMPFEEAIYFGKEAPLPENEGVDTFLFHKYE